MSTSVGATYVVACVDCWTGVAEWGLVASDMQRLAQWPREVLARRGCVLRREGEKFVVHRQRSGGSNPLACEGS